MRATVWRVKNRRGRRYANSINMVCPRQCGVCSHGERPIMTPLIEPAKFAIRSDGVLYSLKFGDVYLNGNGLPERWRARRVFTIVETGFGLGLNFISTWALWRNDPARCNRL